MRELSASSLARLYECPVERAARYAPALSAACAEYAIEASARLAMFLAQIGHESGGLAFVRELWGPTPAQRRYERNALAAWPPTPDDDRNRLAYRLGNHVAGDGRRFLGRGLIQTTGRANHARAAAALGEDFVERPALLEAPAWAARSAAWFWADHGLNALADAGAFDAVTRVINGGQNGRDARMALWFRALEEFA